ncbi:Poliovirus receptor like protein [Fukomys damarensis]|uniref:Poliovirus receptor like protein n=1 Tax=Fukomys damarensis TaxID=885580 RepID=A0A091DTL0_FUKDA|nr:Poliovirus receptor like protein [Fukomys damarensis]
MTAPPQPRASMALAALWLLSLSSVPSGAGPGTLSVQVPPEVRGLLGQSVTLPCQLQSLEPGTNVTQQTWEHQQLAGPVHTVAVFHPTRGPNVQEPERVNFANAKPGADLRNASLTVSELRAEDEGTYTCRIATFPQGTASNSTQLRVLEVNQEILSAGPVPGTGCPEGIKRGHSGGRPPARVSWLLGNSDLNGTFGDSRKSGPLPGTVTVASLLSVVPSSRVHGKQVVCRVEHETLAEPEALPVNLSVPYLPEVSISGYDHNWYLGRSEVTLNCNVRSNPEPRDVVWNTTTGTLPLSAEPQKRQLLIRTIDESINTTFVCLATNSVGTGQGKLTVLLQEAPLGDKSGPRTSIIIIVVLVSTFVVILSGYYYYRRRGRRPARSSANGVNRQLPGEVVQRRTAQPEASVTLAVSTINDSHVEWEEEAEGTKEDSQKPASPQSPWETGPAGVCAASCHRTQTQDGDTGDPEPLLNGTPAVW